MLALSAVFGYCERVRRSEERIFDGLLSIIMPYDSLVSRIYNVVFISVVSCGFFTHRQEPTGNRQAFFLSITHCPEKDST